MSTEALSPEVVEGICYVLQLNFPGWNRHLITSQLCKTCFQMGIEARDIHQKITDLSQKLKCAIRLGHSTPLMGTANDNETNISASTLTPAILRTNLIHGKRIHKLLTPCSNRWI